MRKLYNTSATTMAMELEGYVERFNERARRCKLQLGFGDNCRRKVVTYVTDFQSHGKGFSITRVRKERKELMCIALLISIRAID